MKDIIPKHIQFEPINGVCTTRCIMCTWKMWTRKPNTMSNDAFKSILEKFGPYREDIQYVSLTGWGEPLLDRGLPGKIKIAKDMGFRGTGFATNCTELDEGKAKELIESGLDTIICSIDGINKKTHETIRVGSDFGKIVSNVQDFIKIRNGSGKTRVMVRFIRQDINKQEWPLFFDYWSKQLNRDFGDEVVKFDVHNYAGKVDRYEDKDPNRNLKLGSYLCEELSMRMLIRSNGDVGFCDADINGDIFDLGNALDSDPIEIYNNEVFNHHREMMQEGRILELEYCKECTIPRSRALKQSG